MEESGCSKQNDLWFYIPDCAYLLYFQSAKVGEVLKAQESDNRIIAAICAAPNVLKTHDIAKGKRLTSYPSVKDDLVNDYKYIENDIVVIDGNYRTITQKTSSFLNCLISLDKLITSKGPATAYAFGLAIVEKLLSKEEAAKVAKGLLYNDYK